MTTFVLVPGAWGGAWMWEPVTRELTAAGHTVHAVTLPGLHAHGSEERSSITLDDHVAYVRGLLDEIGETGVVLAGHSYAGIVAGLVAAAEPERVGHTVFVDANVPVDGHSMIDGWSPEGRAHVTAAIEANGGLWPVLSAEDLDGQDFDDARLALFLGRSLPHPGRTIFGVAKPERPLTELSATYINCTLNGEDPNPAAAPYRDVWRFVELRTGHWPMLTKPKELAAILRAV
ncbi:alpha/beta fold hydrolase [Actinorhabdospora filicis]|uniref:alpha/beta fold hydrolase n=1 Tax=Actinorhabdospora filicis TaxID=1785913 RepID=UPI0025572A2A|nr:alpha/beta hydrolase [Actinorhabdospora filicis]